MVKARLLAATNFQSVLNFILNLTLWSKQDCLLQLQPTCNSTWKWIMRMPSLSDCGLHSFITLDWLQSLYITMYDNVNSLWKKLILFLLSDNGHLQTLSLYYVPPSGEGILFSSSPSIHHKSLYVQLVLHFKLEYLNTLHAYLFPYADSHIIITEVIRPFIKELFPFEKLLKVRISVNHVTVKRSVVLIS